VAVVVVRVTQAQQLQAVAQVVLVQVLVVQELLTQAEAAAVLLKAAAVTLATVEQVALV
jgi:hypothetical protein